MSETIKAFFSGVLRGLESPADIYTSGVYTYPHASESEALRDDWNRVGATIRDAMKTADVEATA